MRSLNIVNKFSGIFLMLKTYGLVLFVFTVFRIILFLSEINRIDLGDVSILTIIQSFIMGIRFDTVITSYILLLPVIIIVALNFFTKKWPKIKSYIFYWIFILFTVAFTISAADIPYFNQFYSRFSMGAFEWFDNLGFVFSMIIEEPKYFLVIIPFILLISIFYKVLKIIFKDDAEIIKPKLGVNVLVSLFFILLVLVSIRGRVQKKSPIRIGTAYFSDNSFLNKLGLNPVFTLMRSYLDSKDKDNLIIKLMDDEMAIKNVQHYLGINNPEFDSPIARRILVDSIPSKKQNVVLIIMESMSAAKMTRHGNPNNLTPFLDSLSKQSYYFEKIYTSGKHTFNGIFSTLFSFPAVYHQHPMKQIKQYDGLASTLVKHDYTTSYFTTHDSQFDNVEGFLRANGFQNIISQANYPLDEIKTTLGVPDDYMFRFSFNEIDKLAKERKPFLATFMTTSDHGPFYIPDYFQPKNIKIKQQIVEYADWSLKQFISSCSKKEWFNNTLFVFIADHGAAMNPKYDIALNYHHSPLIFYAPKYLKPTTFNNIGGQIDIYPTIMGMLNLPYINNTLGIDLLSEKRPYIIINDDDKFGVLDTSQLLIIKKDEIPKLYNYSDKDIKDYFEKKRVKAKDMETYGKSNLQTFQYMQLKKKTALNQ